MPDWQDLDTAFTLPPFIPADSEWRTLYVRLQHRTQMELEHLELNTLELLMVERYLTGYIINRFREALPLSDDAGYRDASVAKDVNAHWLGIARSVTDLIENGRKRAASDMVSKRAVQKLIMDSALEVLGPDVASRFLPDLADRFDRLGVG